MSGSGSEITSKKKHEYKNCLYSRLLYTTKTAKALYAPVLPVQVVWIIVVRRTTRHDVTGVIVVARRVVILLVVAAAVSRMRGASGSAALRVTWELVRRHVLLVL